MDLKFRIATEEDIPAIHSLAGKIWREYYPAIITLQQIDYMLQNKYSPAAITTSIERGEKYFLAFADNNPIGYASIEKKDEGYFLHKLYVNVTEHQKGVGRDFFNFILSHIDHGKEIRLQVNRQNYKAINFYFKAGFIIESVGDFEIGDGYYMNDFVMVRKAR